MGGGGSCGAQGADGSQILLTSLEGKLEGNTGTRFRREHLKGSKASESQA